MSDKTLEERLQKEAMRMDYSSGPEEKRIALLCYEAYNELERLRTELAACRRDAERYRWLRDGPSPSPAPGWLSEGGEGMDRHIDQEIAKRIAVDKAVAAEIKNQDRLDWILRHAKLVSDNMGRNHYAIESLVFDAAGEIDTGSAESDCRTAIDSAIAAEGEK